MFIEIIKFFEDFIVLDVKTLIGVLIWGDLALAFLTFGYFVFHESDRERALIKRFGVAKIIQAIAWVLLFLRGEISPIASIYIGNILLYFSFYLDSLITLKMNKDSKKMWFRLQNVLLGFIIILFLFFEISFGRGNIRIMIASLSVFGIQIIPNIINITNRKSSRFEKFVGLSNLVFLILLFLRAFNSLLVEDMSLFTNNYLQSGTFISLLLLMFVNGAGFLLIMYEHSYELLKESVNLDHLTQIATRRFFMKKADAYYQRAMREQKSLSLLFIDKEICNNLLI